jgi:phosphatidylserine decarboxylase
MSDVTDRLAFGALGLLPKNLWSRAVGAVAYAKLPRPIARASISMFARAYDIDVGEAAESIEDFRTLGAFFTRRLRSGARPIDRRPGLAVSPADGHILNSGRITDGELIQAKGRRFTVADLLGPEEGELFRNGHWVTVYLSPQDYHRVHHPVEGRLVRSRYVPGHLWPVNRIGVECVDDLFCVNERVITIVDSPVGRVASVMVGATSVGHITVSHDPELHSNHGQAAHTRDYDVPATVQRGGELGVFHLGSTVIVVFADPEVELEALAPGAAVRVGEGIARRAI